MNQHKLKIVAIGGTHRACLTLKSLLTRTDIEIVYLIVMPGYSDEISASEELVNIADKNCIPSITASVIDSKILNIIKNLCHDVFIGIGIWRSILSKEFLNTAKFGYFGLHGTALPLYRGFAGINWQIINGDKFIKMRPLQLGCGIDDGDLMCSSNGDPYEYSLPIDNEKHLQEIFDEYNKVHIQATNDIIDNLITGNYILSKQDNSISTYSCHRGPDDGEIDWTKSTFDVFNFIRALSFPCPGAFTYYKGDKVFIWKVKPRREFSRYTGRICGKVVQRNKDVSSVVILTADSAIEILDAQITTNKELQPCDIFTSVRDRCKSRIDAYLDKIEF